jgi:hypothetical protein
MLAACGSGGSTQTTASEQTPSTPVSTTPPSSTTPAPSPGNKAPTISGSAAASAVAGKGYSFTPTAADADLDTISFTIANKPSWAAFNARTGALTGTPAAKDAGTYAAIEIAATDGKAVTALPAFAIAVTAATAVAGNVSVSWVPPTVNDDGSTLTDLAGYKIHYGTKTGSYTGSVTVPNAGISRYELESLPTGQVFIAMTALNASGAESALSPEIKVMVN